LDKLRGKPLGKTALNATPLYATTGIDEGMFFRPSERTERIGNKAGKCDGRSYWLVNFTLLKL
jgi:hypothetical protein